MQNGPRELSFEVLKCERLHPNEINDGLDLAQHAENLRIVGVALSAHVTAQTSSLSWIAVSTCDGPDVVTIRVETQSVKVGALPGKLLR